MAISSVLDNISIHRMQRIKKIDQIVCTENVNQTELAKRLGLSKYTVKNDLDLLKEFWKEQHGSRYRERRYKRGRELDYLKEQALRSWEKSKDGGVEEIVVHYMADCPFCQGSGVRAEDWCKKCSGEGKITRTEVKHVRKVLPGDVTYLQAATKCLVEIIKLEGLAAPQLRKIKKQTDVRSQHWTMQVTNKENPYLEAPDELLHKALAAINDLKNPLRQIEGNVVHEPANQTPA